MYWVARTVAVFRLHTCLLCPCAILMRCAHDACLFHLAEALVCLPAKQIVPVMLHHTVHMLTKQIMDMALGRQ